jgi:hypothetical protein
MLTHDLRKYPRVRPPRSFVVAWRSGMTRDVSYMDSLALGGLFIHTRHPMPLRSGVQLLLDTPAGQVRGRGIVRRVDERHGMALQIIAMDPSDRALLHRELRDLFASEPSTLLPS